MKTWRLQFLVIVNFILYFYVEAKRYPKHPEVALSFEKKVKLHGYPIELHRVETPDDYILSLYHIPHGLKQLKNESNNKSVVLLIHGMGGEPSNFLIIGKKRSAPYYFADRGFDVWVFCARGVDGSFKKKHKKYDWNEHPKYWDYSFHDIGVYDIPSTIDYVLKNTFQRKLFLVGHSAGGNSIFAMLSEKPKYNTKVKMTATWASSPILKRCDYQFVIFLATLVDLWKGMFKYLGMKEFFPQFQILKPMIREMCADPAWKKVCIVSSWVVGSHESVLQHVDDIELIGALAPPRVSVRQICHFMDNYNFGDFRKYHYGTKKNLQIYGQKYTPRYNLSACTAPIAFFIGPRDSIIIKEDIMESIENIPNAVLIHEVNYSKFTHTDFIFARNASELVYEPTLKLFKDFDRGIVPPRIIVSKDVDQEDNIL